MTSLSTSDSNHKSSNHEVAHADVDDSIDGDGYDSMDGNGGDRVHDNVGGKHEDSHYQIIDNGEGRVAVLRLDDGKANAINHGSLAAIDQAVAGAERDAQALVIAGRDGCFIAGFDLGLINQGPDAARDLVTAGAHTAMRIHGARVPVVMACTGHALAFGAILLLCSDVRVGVDANAKIGLNEVSIGLPVPVFAVELARNRLTPRYFTAATTLATVYAPEDAVKAGFLDELAASESVIDVAIARAGALGDRLRPVAFARTRRNTRQAVINHILSTLDEDLSDFALSE